MKKIKYLMALLLVVAFLSSCSNKDKYENMLDNGDFSENIEKLTGPSWQGIGSWSLLSMNAGDGSFQINKNKELQIDIKSFGSSEYSIQLNYKGITLVQDSVYYVGFDIKSEEEQPVACLVQQNYGSYLPYFKKDVVTTKEMTHFEGTFTAEKTDENVSFVFNMGTFKNRTIKKNTVYLDNIILAIEKGSSDLQNDAKNILVNQIGYKVNAKKTAVIRGESFDKSFDVVNVKTNQIVYTGTIDKPKDNKSSNEKCVVIDFSSVNAPGKYKIVTKSSGESFEFEIKDDVYNELFTSVVEMFYTQRCGCEVIGGDYAHSLCHIDTATIWNTTDTIDVTGGWHDAGDFGKYVVPGAKTVQDLLLAYELYGDIFKYKVDIPEKKNDIPDILDEAVYELEWLLKMQNEEGKVYHKITSYNFPGNDIMADRDILPMVVSAPSYAATGDFAAVMASAARVYEKILPEKALSYKEAAIKAFDALQNMDAVTFTNPSDITTGEYGDSNLGDEYLWAAIELYRTTKDTKYKTLYDEKLKVTNTKDVGFGWDNMTGYALYSCAKALNSNDESSKEALANMKYQANKYVENINNDAYGSSVGEMYFWGSNLTICNSTELFILLNDLGDNNYINNLQTELDYLLGKNTTEYSFVTGFGTKSPKNPHHRPSITTQKAVPGMLVGGPNNDFANNGGDSIATSKLKGKASAAGSYIDNDGSWSINEVTIYWNSPLVLLLAALM